MRNSKRSHNTPQSSQPAQPAPSSGSDPRAVVHHAEMRAARWAGPLPSPEDVQQYNELVPNGAERLFAEWEAEGSHRRKSERRALSAEIFERIGSRVMAFLFALSALGAASYCAFLDQPWPASVIGGGTIAAVVAAMVYKRKE